MSDERMLAELEERDGAGVVRVADVFATDPGDLWSAITDPDRLARWIAEVRGDFRVGGSVAARFTSSWTGTLVVRECRPPEHLLVDSVEEDGVATEIEAWLSPVDGGTRLVIEDRGLPLDQYSAHGAGWQVHLEDLRAHLEGRPASTWHDRWVELSEPYAILARG